MSDDIEIVRRALRSSLVGSAPDTLAALDRIEAELERLRSQVAEAAMAAQGDQPRS